MNSKSKSSFERAIALRDDGRYADAINELHDILSTESDTRIRSVALGEIGIIYHEHIKNHHKAVQTLRECTSICPKAELPSLYLFYALTELGQFDDALAEAARFLRLRPRSLEYRRLIREFASDGGSDYA